VLREYGKPLSLEELELEPPKEKEVLVKYAYTGFCHSDLPILKTNEKYRVSDKEFRTAFVNRCSTFCGLILFYNTY
jgi:threonine dehydrogenase-like Zn-dependent dehydrogenase